MPNAPSNKLSDPEYSKIRNSTIPQYSLCNRHRLQRYQKGYTIAPSQNTEEYIYLRPNYRKFKSIIKVTGFYCPKSIIQIHHHYYASASLEVTYALVYIVKLPRERSLNNRVEIPKDFPQEYSTGRLSPIKEELPPLVTTSTKPTLHIQCLLDR